MKKLLYLAICAIAFTACSIDNYDMPSVKVTGNIIDSETQELVPSGGTNGGSIVRFYENNSTQPLIYRTLPDGNFVNEAVFPGSYSYTAEGPFVPVEAAPKAVTVDGNTEIEIPVIPYLRLTVSVANTNGGAAEVKVEYKKVREEDVFTNVGFVYSTYPNPNSFTSVGGVVILDDVAGQDLTTGEKTYSVSGLVAGKKYYFRAVGLVANPGSYFNYSNQVEVEAQ